LVYWKKYKKYFSKSKKMRIGIDARQILNPEKNPAIGVGHYTYQLIRNLLQIDAENQYTLFFDYRVREKDIKKFSKPNVKIKYFPWSDYKKYLPGAYSEILGLATLSRNNLDILHVTSPDSRVPLGYRGKVVCTFQDLAVYKYPKLFPKPKRIKARYNRRAMAKRADKIIAVSENTKKDLLKNFDIQEEKIEVIYNGVDKRFFASSEEGQKIFNNLKDKHKFKENFILFVGTLEPIKNITRLLEAYRILKDSIEEDESSNNDVPQLLVVGKRGWLASEYLQIVKDLNIEKDVKFLGYVEGEELKELLRKANIFVMPSLYEGFGMSVLEAMAVGTPCLVSKIETLEEIADQAVEFIDPFDIEGMASKMKNLLLDQFRRKELSQKGKVRAKQFSWKECARKTLKVYQKLADFETN